MRDATTGTFPTMTSRNGMDSRDHVIDWIAPREGKPFVRRAAEAIAARLPRSHGVIDGTRAVVCVPSSRGARILSANLLDVAEAEGTRLDPPAVVTADSLADRLLAARGEDEIPARATRLERTVAWRRSLAEATPAELRRLGVRNGVALAEDSLRSLASVAIALEDELGREGRTFLDAEAAVPVVAKGMFADDEFAVPDESERWAALASVHRRVAARLASAGLASRVDRERLLVERGEPVAGRLFLVGFLELSGAVRRLAGLQPVTIVLPEPLRPAERDAFGLPKEGMASIDPVPLGEIRVAGSPRGQADEAIEFLATVAAGTPAPASDEVAIGVADPELVPTIAAALRDAGLPARDPAGRPAAGREPLRALAAALAWSTGRSAASLATLARCPSVAAAAMPDADPVAELDAFLGETRLLRLDGDLPEAAIGVAAVRTFRDAIERATETLDGPAVGPLAAAAAIAESLRRLGVDREPDDRRLLGKFLERLATASPAVVGLITPADAARLLLELAASAREPADPRPDEIELLGWLELLFEPAPYLCVVGMNEGKVADARPAPAWLTPSMAAALGLPDPARRLARDAAMLEALRRFHAEPGPGLRLVFGRRSAAGDPALPSRLLLGGGGEDLARRVESLFREPPAVRRPASGRARTAFTVPVAPEGLRDSIESMGVTDFRAYLADPGRFWLERRERLREIVAEAAELDPMAFGTLAHHVIEAAFADPAVRGSTDAFAIREAFLGQLAGLARERIGPRPRPAIRLQLRSLGERLERLAEREAEQRRAGWTIVNLEETLGEAWSLEPEGGGKPMRIAGRIDRIERDGSGPVPRYRVLDAKTSEDAKTPRKAHRAGRKGAERWIDLQLPLYRHFAARQLGVDPGSVATGYLQLPADPDGVAFVMSDFGDDEYADAIDEARRVIARIRAGEFTPGPARFRDDPLRFILQEAVFTGDEAGTEEPS
jgi:ATP-dependent helicase/nuclease subunit B